MRTVARTFALCAVALMGCSGEVTDSPAGQDLSNAGAGGTSPVADGATGSGGSGSVPSLDASAADASGDADASGEAAPSADSGGAVCPILVSGTDLTEADCYACIGADAECVSAPPFAAFTVESCVNIVSLHTTLWCAWYADDAPVDRISAMVTCKSNPGRVVCGGGL